ncbi:S-layer homology domain-containing protein [Paenibacillus sp. D2_2]|uniref:S-layer homology domain-containing protein n=1 Tax=Paenibacillus sp. D2_2 TaxID=3073092 RepID=UPI00281511CA|nr:S-layer homology domain-containing protein [Paenibacillus sp. D2_2]WMT39093.1 S-layer homology domain-containing protein [Paenibacillus sp. D2_2]
MKRRKLNLAVAALLCGSLLLIPVASAFNDVQGDDARMVESLQDRGIIQGISQDKFVPLGKVTGAQGVHMIVQALGLKAKSEGPAISRNTAKNRHWYDESLAIAEENEIKMPQGFSVSKELTREQFAFLLQQGIHATGDYPLVAMLIQVKDADEVTTSYFNSVQTLLLMKITALDDAGKFHPKQPLNRIEAAKWVYNSREYVDNHGKADDPMQDEVTYSVEKVNDQINKVILQRESQPNPGYGITVTKVEFGKDQVATIYYELLSPKPGQMYPQVITTTKTETYIASSYKVKLVQDTSPTELKRFK